MKFTLTLAAMTLSAFAHADGKSVYTCAEKSNPNNNVVVELVNPQDMQSQITVNYPGVSFDMVGTLSATHIYAEGEGIVSITYSGTVGARCEKGLPCPKLVRQDNPVLFRNQNTGVLQTYMESDKVRLDCTGN
jgi:hypothetical protein